MPEPCDAVRTRGASRRAWRWSISRRCAAGGGGREEAASLAVSELARWAKCDLARFAIGVFHTTIGVAAGEANQFLTLAEFHLGNSLYFQVVALTAAVLFFQRRAIAK